jgi:DNA topoisomerase VI subunit B
MRNKPIDVKARKISEWIRLQARYLPHAHLFLGDPEDESDMSLRNMEQVPGFVFQHILTQLIT